VGTLIAYTGETYKYLGYAIGGEFDGLYVDVKESPIFVSDGNLIIGVLNNRLFQQYLLINNHKPTDTGYKSVLQSFDFIKNYEKFSGLEMLMINSDGNIYYWKDGIMHDIKAHYFAIGKARDIAIGCMYGLRSSSYQDQERMEITLKAVTYNRPNQGMSTGIERI
jgi:hypothetical protein